MAIRSFSIEDGNLQDRPLIGTRRVDYSDVDLYFEIDTTGDVYKKLDAAAVKQSVKNIILSNYGEKPFKPFFGTDIRALLFELYDFGLENDIKLRIRTALKRYEPRAEIVELTVEGERDENQLFVEIIFKVVNTNEIVTLNTSLSRLR